MYPYELMVYAGVAVRMAFISWFASVMAYMLEAGANRKLRFSIVFLIVAGISVVAMIGFIIAAKIAERSF